LICAKFLHPVFDAKEEVLTNFPTWVKLLNLPLEFWTNEGLRAIGEVLGFFMNPWTWCGVT
jgi:hypothetical protein